MNYDYTTKGKYHTFKIDGMSFIKADYYLIAKMCKRPADNQTYRDTEITANAERICQCVNGWDALVKQRDDLLAACESIENQMYNGNKHKNGSYDIHIPKEMAEQLRQAIAAVKNITNK